MDLFEDSVLRVARGLHTGGLNVTDPETTEEVETVDFSHEKGSPSTPEVISTVTTKNLLHHPDAHPIALDLLMLKKYGLDWLEWDAETIEFRLPRDLNSTISEVNAHKINAMKTLHLVDSFWERWEVFTWCTMSFNGFLPNFEIMQVPTVSQCALSVDVANRVRSDTKWSIEMEKYLQSVHIHDGVLCTQPPLDFVQIDTSTLVIHSSEIEKEWPTVRASKKAPQDDSVLSEQLRRMLAIYEYVEVSRSLLRQQIRVVQSV